ncbi:hypothetical protein [Fibrobacter sp.]|uniref:hypothetical protein n=1 Tax=Fibrobacter sp. TaxID=35828 RepID=UPI0038677240
MMKRILCLIMVAMAFSFAQEEIFIRNICDTLGGKKVELQLQQIEETMWYGSKNLSKSDSVKKTVYKDYQDVNPLKGKFEDAVLPVSVTASCVESRYNLFRYATWSNSHWSLVDDDDDYATMIMDVNQYSYQGYDATNSYNILAIKKGALPENGSYSTNELMVSKTFEFSFDWWYSIALYYVGTRYFYASVVALDSLTAVEKSMGGLDVPDSISKVQLQVLHGVLVDPNKNLPESSSSEQEISSSSEGTTALGRMERTPRVFNGAREVRRLDGSVVKQGESLEPGVYYVKGSDGRWKKSVQMR